MDLLLKTLRELEESVKKYGIAPVSIFLTGFIALSSLLYGFYYVSECGFNPTLYFSFSDYIDAYIFKALTIFSFFIFLSFSYLFFSPSIPWNLFPKFTKAKADRYNFALTFSIVGCAYIYLENITSHLPSSSFSTLFIILISILMIIYGLTYGYKILPKAVLTVCFISTISIPLAMLDAKRAITTPNHYHIEYADGKSESIVLFASSSNYLLCQSLAHPVEKKAIQTRYVKAITPVNNKAIEHPLTTPPALSRAGEFHDPK